MANRYSLHYTGVINELMAKLADARDYFDIHQYATRSLEIEPGNIKVRYWQSFADDTQKKPCYTHIIQN